MNATPFFKLMIAAALSLTAVSFSCNKEETSVSMSREENGPSVSAIYCSSAAFSASASTGIVYNGTARVPYTGGNGGIYSKEFSIASTGVTGLTARLQTGTLANGFGNLFYTITGTPTAAGTAYFMLGFGGQTCTLQLIVSH